MILSVTGRARSFPLSAAEDMDPPCGRARRRDRRATRCRHFRCQSASPLIRSALVMTAARVLQRRCCAFGRSWNRHRRRPADPRHPAARVYPAWHLDGWSDPRHSSRSSLVASRLDVRTVTDAFRRQLAGAALSGALGTTVQRRGRRRAAACATIPSRRWPCCGPGSASRGTCPSGSWRRGRRRTTVPPVGRARVLLAGHGREAGTASR